jgi:Undecaprenyl-phosphate glucose phosphotransferase
MILRLKLYRLFMKAAIYALAVFAFYSGWWAWRAVSEYLQRAVLYRPHEHTGHILFGLVVWAFLSEQYKVTNFDELFRERTGARALTSACIATLFCLVIALFFGRNTFPRGLLVCDVSVLFVSAIVLHACFRLLFRNQVYLAKPVRLLVIGADQFARKSAARLQRLSFSPCEVAGYVRVPGQEIRVRGQHVYEMEELAVLASNRSFDEAVIAIPPAEFAKIPEILNALRSLCIPARAIVDLGEGVVVKERLFQLGNMQMLNLTSTPTESLDYALAKRAFDIAFSLLVLLVTSPIFALITFLIKITAEGPVFFVQERVGLNGRPFQMWKFRTMRVSATQESDTLWTTREDSRKTLIGAFLRKTSLDELPQFVNVLKGDMSVVGPRPERPHFVHKFLQEITRYNARHALKVGITGWAQVNGWRGDTSIEKRVEYDLYYLQNWSLAFDIRIIVMTLLAGLTNKNAY